MSAIPLWWARISKGKGRIQGEIQWRRELPPWMCHLWHVDGPGVQAGQPSQMVFLPHCAPQFSSKAFYTWWALQWVVVSICSACIAFLPSGNRTPFSFEKLLHHHRWSCWNCQASCPVPQHCGLDWTRSWARQYTSPLEMVTGSGIGLWSKSDQLEFTSKRDQIRQTDSMLSVLAHKLWTRRLGLSETYWRHDTDSVSKHSYSTFLRSGAKRTLGLPRGIY